MKQFNKKYGCENSYQKTLGEKLDQEETETFIKDYLKELDMEDQVTINFNPNLLVNTSMGYDTRTGKSKINVKIPVEYYRKAIVPLLHHEIGTHFLRKFNDKQQKWFKKDKYDIKPCIVTEEGFAVVNQLMFS